MAALDILYFAWVREQVGTGTERVELPADASSVASVIAWLAGRDETHGAALADTGRLRAALDGRFVTLDAPLGDARELAIFPPVTGG